MPYFLNCIRCNDDNSYQNINYECKKCDGTGRDWRDDKELENYHKWSNLTLTELKSKEIITVEDNSNIHVFTYRNKILSVKEDKAEVEKLYGVNLSKKEDIPTFFCNHEWKSNISEGVVCILCGFKQKDNNQPELNKSSKLYEYNKDLHDNRYYYPNRCEGCHEYASTRGDILSGGDSVLCNIGGEVRADTGCDNFKEDITASCRDCWNYKKNFNGSVEQYFCDIHNQLKSVITGFCPEYVCKERTKNPIPRESNCVEISRSMIGTDEYPRDPTVRKVILGAMDEVGLLPETIRGHNCCNCHYQASYGGYVWGHCLHHSIFLICQDDKCCEYFEPSVNSNIDQYPEIEITATLYVGGTKHYPLNDEVALCAKEGHKFSLVEREGHKLLCELEDYLLRSVQYAEEKDAILINYIDKKMLINPKTGKEIIQKINNEEKSIISWMDAISEDEYFEKVDDVSKEQRHHGVYSGDTMTNCERCSNVVRDSSYPNGSPTGLKCKFLDVFITANGACDSYTR